MGQGCKCLTIGRVSSSSCSRVSFWYMDYRFCYWPSLIQWPQWTHGVYWEAYQAYSFNPLFYGKRGLDGALSSRAVLCSYSRIFLVNCTSLSMIGTLALCPLSRSCCVLLWAPDCNSVVHSIHSLMERLSARTEPLNSCFNQWRLIRIASGFPVCHLWSLL